MSESDGYRAPEDLFSWAVVAKSLVVPEKNPIGGLLAVVFFDGLSGTLIFGSIVDSVRWYWPTRPEALQRNDFVL